MQNQFWAYIWTANGVNKSRLLPTVRSKTSALQRRGPPLVQSKGAHVLRSEVMALLAKGAGEMGLQPRASQASTAVTSSSPKKMEGYGPILDLRTLNRAFMSWPFRMIMLKQILSQICPGDWFFSLDLRDAYFYIQIAPTTGHSWDSPSRLWLIGTRSCPLDCPWLPAVLRSAWTQLFPL